MDERVPNLPEAMDACRPDSDDLQLPEMRQLAEQVQLDPETGQLLERAQGMERAMTAAMHDVPVPADLSHKLLSSLSQQEAVLSAQAPRGDQQTVVSLPASRLARRAANRRLIRLVAAITACLGVAVFASVRALYTNQESPTGPLLEELRTCLDNPLPGHWQQDLQRSPRRNEFEQQDIFKNPRQWQPLVTRNDDAAVAYDLRSNAGQPFAALIVLRTNQRFAVPNRLPRIPDSTTGGFCMGVFQRDGVVFVLVVEGNERRYRRYAGPVQVVI